MRTSCGPVVWPSVMPHRLKSHREDWPRRASLDQVIACLYSLTTLKASSYPIASIPRISAELNPNGKCPSEVRFPGICPSEYITDSVAEICPYFPV